MVNLRSIKLTFLFLFSGVAVMAVTKSEKITVNGSCEICKNRIENAVSSLDGVKQAQWDPETRNWALATMIKRQAQKGFKQQLQWRDTILSCSAPVTRGTMNFPDVVVTSAMLKER